MLEYVANLTTGHKPARTVWHQGREWLVAPAVSIVPGVLPGSKGPLMYPPGECARNAHEWDGIPLVLYHPTDSVTGEHLSAKSQGIVARQGLGVVKESSFDGRLKHNLWFDAARTKKLSPTVYQALKMGNPIELSTGLFTTNDPAPPGAHHNGRSYDYIARDYVPDHLAILPDQRGACSLSDGCGVLVNKRSVPVVGGMILPVGRVAANANGGNPNQPRDEHGRWTAAQSSLRALQATQATPRQNFPAESAHMYAQEAAVASDRAYDQTDPFKAGALHEKAATLHFRAAGRHYLAQEQGPHRAAHNAHNEAGRLHMNAAASLGPIAHQLSWQAHHASRSVGGAGTATELADRARYHSESSLAERLHTQASQLHEEMSKSASGHEVELNKQAAELHRKAALYHHYLTANSKIRASSDCPLPFVTANDMKTVGYGKYVGEWSGGCGTGFGGFKPGNTCGREGGRGRKRKRRRRANRTRFDPNATTEYKTPIVPVVGTTPPVDPNPPAPTTPPTVNPFVSEAQRRACYAKRARGEKGWNCDEWESKTHGKLPKRKKVDNANSDQPRDAQGRWTAGQASQAALAHSRAHPGRKGHAADNAKKWSEEAAVRSDRAMDAPEEQAAVAHDRAAQAHSRAANYHAQLRSQLKGGSEAYEHQHQAVALHRRAAISHHRAANQFGGWHYERSVRANDASEDAEFTSGHSFRALIASDTGKHSVAAREHLQAAKFHERAAQQSSSPLQVERHQRAARLHREAHAHSRGMVGNTMNDFTVNPFVSEAQRRYMWKFHPEIAHKWAHGEHSSEGHTHRMPTVTGPDVRGPLAKAEREEQRRKRKKKFQTKRGQKTGVGNSYFGGTCNCGCEGSKKKGGKCTCKNEGRDTGIPKSGWSKARDEMKLPKVGTSQSDLTYAAPTPAQLVHGFGRADVGHDQDDPGPDRMNSPTPLFGLEHQDPPRSALLPFVQSHPDDNTMSYGEGRRLFPGRLGNPDLGAYPTDNFWSDAARAAAVAARRARSASSGSGRSGEAHHASSFAASKSEAAHSMLGPLRAGAHEDAAAAHRQASLKHKRAASSPSPGFSSRKGAGHYLTRRHLDAAYRHEVAAKEHESEAYRSRNVGNASYFGTCARDDRGHCLPSTSRSIRRTTGGILGGTLGGLAGGAGGVAAGTFLGWHAGGPVGSTIGMLGGAGVGLAAGATAGALTGRRLLGGRLPKDLHQMTAEELEHEHQLLKKVATKTKDAASLRSIERDMQMVEDEKRRMAKKLAGNSWTYNAGTDDSGGDNCGTGSGGFQPGNTCARGSSSGGGRGAVSGYRDYAGPRGPFDYPGGGPYGGGGFGGGPPGPGYGVMGGGSSSGMGLVSRRRHIVEARYPPGHREKANEASHIALETTREVKENKGFGARQALFGGRAAKKAHQAAEASEHATASNAEKDPLHSSVLHEKASNLHASAARNHARSRGIFAAEGHSKAERAHSAASLAHRDVARSLGGTGADRSAVAADASSAAAEFTPVNTKTGWTNLYKLANKALATSEAARKSANKGANAFFGGSHSADAAAMHLKAAALHTKISHKSGGQMSENHSEAARLHTEAARYHKMMSSRERVENVYGEGPRRPFVSGPPLIISPSNGGWTVLNASGGSHMNPDGTFKGGFSGCVAHFKGQGKTDSQAHGLCGKIARMKGMAPGGPHYHANASYFGSCKRDAYGRCLPMSTGKSMRRAVGGILGAVGGATVGGIAGSVGGLVSGGIGGAITGVPVLAPLGAAGGYLGGGALGAVTGGVAGMYAGRRLLGGRVPKDLDRMTPEELDREYATLLKQQYKLIRKGPKYSHELAEVQRHADLVEQARSAYQTNAAGWWESVPGPHWNVENTYFAECDRDRFGRCLARGAAGAAGAAASAAGKGVAATAHAGAKIAAGAANVAKHVLATAADITAAATPQILKAAGKVAKVGAKVLGEGIKRVAQRYGNIGSIATIATVGGAYVGWHALVAAGTSGLPLAASGAVAGAAATSAPVLLGAVAFGLAATEIRNVVGGLTGVLEGGEAGKVGKRMLTRGITRNVNIFMVINDSALEQDVTRVTPHMHGLALETQKIINEFAEKTGVHKPKITLPQIKAHLIATLKMIRDGKDTIHDGKSKGKTR